VPVARRGELEIDYIDEGDGLPIVLAHSSVSGNRQWKRLIERLRTRNRVIAPNLLGYGKTTPWAGGRMQTIDDAAEVVLGLCDDAKAPLRLVGHSWGGYVALWAARKLGERVSHLALYEPMIPGLLRGHDRKEAWSEASALYEDVKRLGDSNQWEALARRFTDYFNGDGSWEATDDDRRRAIAAQLLPNRHEWDAGTRTVTARELGPVAARTLLMRGTRTRPVMREVVDVLREAYLYWNVLEIQGAGHMGPLTHAEAVNSEIADFLDS